MRLGIRVQLGVALAALLLLAFLPLYFAVANLTRASMASARDASARSLGRVIAAHVGEAREARGSDVGSLLEAQLGQGGVAAIAVYGHGGVLERRARNRCRSRSAADTCPDVNTSGWETHDGSS
ncbi:MAG TPA: hypothetical protein VGM56_06095, partial [Byssovorax sp.]